MKQDNMPEHFLALIKQSANLASNVEAGRSAAAVISSLQATLDSSIFSQISNALPSYLQPKPQRQFFLHRQATAKQFNTELYLDRLAQQLNLTDVAEAKNRLRAVLFALQIVQPDTRAKLVASLPTDLNLYW